MVGVGAVLFVGNAMILVSVNIDLYTILYIKKEGLT